MVLSRFGFDGQNTGGTRDMIDVLVIQVAIECLDDDLVAISGKIMQEFKKHWRAVSTPCTVVQ